MSPLSFMFLFFYGTTSTLGAKIGDDFYTWYNWQYDLSCTATGLYAPKNRAELQEWLISKHSIGALIKPVGLGHSFGNITTCVSIDNTSRNESWVVELANIHHISFDSDTGYATFGAGWTLNDLVDYLADHYDATVDNTGTERVQNFVGAFTTGTHGTGKNLGNMATAVRALEILLANGSYFYIDETSEYYGARMTLGVLGIITEVTIQTRNITFMRRIDANISSTNITEFYLNVIDHYEMYSRFQVEEFGSTYDIEGKYWKQDDSARIIIWEEVPSWDGEIGGCKQHALCCGKCYPSNCTDYIYNAIAAPIQGFVCGAWFFAEFEHFFPILNDDPSVILELSEEYIDKFNKINMSRVIEIFEPFDGALSGLQLKLPSVRFVQADDLWMSEANNYNLTNVNTFAVVEIDLLMPFSNFEVIYIYYQFLSEFIPEFGILAGGWNIRPHWGKYFNFDFDYTQQVYPMVHKFKQLRLELDPYCQFINERMYDALGLQDECYDLFNSSIMFMADNGGSDGSDGSGDMSTPDTSTTDAMMSSTVPGGESEMSTTEGCELVCKSGINGIYNGYAVLFNLLLAFAVASAVVNVFV